MNEKMKMNYAASSCLHQAFTGISFFLAFGGMLLVLTVGGFFDVWSAFQEYKKGLLDYGIHFTILQTALKSDAVRFFLPIFSTFPFAASFLEDVESGFIKNYLPRTGRRHYITGKILATGISGGMVSVAGIGIYYIVLQLILLPMEKKAAVEMIGMTYGNDVYRGCVLFFCVGMLFSLLGMLFSVLTSSKYMAYASPFVLEYTLIILHERYLKELYMINPKEWLAPTEGQWFLGQLGVMIFILMLIFLIVMILLLVMMGRIEEL